MTTYAYDSIYRLVGETLSNSVSSAYSVVYHYDLAGNRTSVVVDGVGDPVTNTYTLGLPITHNFF